MSLQNSLPGSSPWLAFAQNKSDRDNHKGEHHDDGCSE
jgi:hypothetical protein